MKAEILKKIGNAIVNEIGEECTISFPEVTKNNGSVMQAVVIRRVGSTVCPRIYIDRLLNEIESGCNSIHDAVAEIIAVYRNSDAWKLSGITEKLNKEFILKNVVYQLVNTERNIERLCDIPHKDFFDLSAIYNVIVCDDRNGTASIPISHKFCDCYGISADELDLAARKNTKEKGFCVTTIAEVMAEIAGIPARESCNECQTMFILTNKARCKGAAVMLYGEYFEELAGKLKSDLYIIPSSIHEVIAVPATGLSPDGIIKMVSEVNENEVDDEEILGYSIYKYDLEAKKFEIVK